MGILHCCSAGIEQDVVQQPVSDGTCYVVVLVLQQDVVQQPVSDGTCYVVVLVLNKMLYNNL